jgi:hypothetical protein
MTTLEELERRVLALEGKPGRTSDDIASIKRDIAKLAMQYDGLLAQTEALNRRVAVFELESKARFDKIDARLDRIEAEQAAFRRDMPGIVGGALREFFGKGQSIE